MIDIKLLETMLDGVAYCKLVGNPSGSEAVYQYVMVNQVFEELSGMQRCKLIGSSVAEITPELASILDLDTTKAQVQTEMAKQEYYFNRCNRWCRVYTCAPSDDELVIVCNDITNWRERETNLAKQNRVLHKRYERLQRKLAKPSGTSQFGPVTESAGSLEKTELREEICNLLCKASDDGLWYWDLVDDRLLLLGSWYRHLNLAEFNPDTNMQQWRKLICPDDLSMVERVFTNYLHGNSEYCRCRYRIEISTGEYQLVELTGKALFDQDGKPYVMAGAHTKVVDSQPQQELLEHLDCFDNLTGLSNRLALMDGLRNAVVLARRHHRKGVAVFMDLKQFRTVKEKYGSEFGDRLLTLIAKRLKRLTRSYENVARWGEDQFAFILQGIQEVGEIIGFCKRLQQAFVEPFELKENQFNLDINIGVAIYSEDGLEPEDLLFNREIALENVKTFMQDNWQFYKPVLCSDFARKNEIRKRLRKALKQRKFCLQYQPQVEMATGKIRAVEALIRWKEPDLGWIVPLEFIPFAEETGLIVPLGEWVIREACRQNVLWQKQFGIRVIMAVNVSAVQLKQASFPNMVKEVLAATGMEPQLLELEITESIMIHSFDTVVAILSELRQMGVRVSLDDFGTGYAWLSYLKRLPLDTLKLDKSIIDDIHYDFRGKNITEAILELVRKLGLTTVAEGVEHQKQLDCLRGSCCDYVQGYLLGRPLFEEEVAKLIQHNGCSQVK